MCKCYRLSESCIEGVVMKHTLLTLELGYSLPPVLTGHDEALVSGESD